MSAGDAAGRVRPKNGDKEVVRILLLEDAPADALLIETELRKARLPFALHRVESRAAYLQALDGFAPDLILSDYNMPQFNALEALRLLRDRGMDIPLLLGTGSQSEEVAVECMRQGAWDYILKSSLRRLPSAVLNALSKREAEREKEKAEVEILRQRAYFQTLIENTSDVITVVDTQGIIRYESPVVERLLGYKPQEMVGRNIFDLVHPDDLALAREVFDMALRTPKAVSPAVEFRCRHKDGSWRPLEAVGKPLVEGGKVEGGVVSSRDVSQRKALEAQLRHSQKMETAGRLAAGVAHDFNNLLTTMLGYSDILLSRLPEGDPMRQDVEEIKKSAERAAALTRQLLAFSRKQVLSLSVVDLNVLLAGMQKMLRRLIGEDVELAVVPAPDLGKVKADPGQIEQVVMNLVVNSRDAMPRGGKIVIRTQNVELRQPLMAGEREGFRPGPHALLSVADTGTGMTAEVMSHIFEPFFTTKEQGKGTGLGLSTVYGIVRQSGGYIEVESQPERGTVFKIYLPHFEGPPEEEAAPASRRRAAGGSETILLVEDERLVRNLCLEVLTKAGYAVLEAQNGEEALRLARENKRALDLIVTDVVMPGMSGRELAKKMTAHHPRAKVLYLSGYADDAVLRHGVMEEGAALIPKPFTPNQLLKKIRDILDASPKKPHA